MSMPHASERFASQAFDLERVLTHNLIRTSALYAASQIRCETVSVVMRDGVRLATDIYLPPQLPAPAIAVRTPYGRGSDNYVSAFMSIARRGYVVLAQDCRGTGDSEPDSWDYYMFEPEDGCDFVEWVGRQYWFDGFVGAFGSSYIGQTQWQMGMHPRMSTIVPEVSGLGIAINTVHLYMFQNAYARAVGKGEGKVPVHYTELEAMMVEETLAGGYFNEPLHQVLPEALLARYPQLRQLGPSSAQRWLWEHYCQLTCAARAAFIKEVLGVENVTTLEVEKLSTLFGRKISHDAHTLPHPTPAELVREFHAPALMITGWYDWGINDTLATWQLLRSEAHEPVRSASRLLITPSAHNKPGYHEGMDRQTELQHNHRTVNNIELLLRWYAAVRSGTTDAWPRVIYYLMGANEWRTASDWPVPGARPVNFYLGSNGTLTQRAPAEPAGPDEYSYDPCDPTPTVGGSIVSYVYPPGSVDVAEVQRREDVLTYTSEPLDQDLDIAGPLRMILYASSSAIDTDFAARLSDVFPDGRAIQLQNGVLRARYREIDGEPALLVPGRIYRFEIDLWATANRFKSGHRLRVDISSADFPRFDRNTNRGGEPGDPVVARQSIHRSMDHPSHLIACVLDAV
jgi:predicted acyl esterase